MKSTIYQVSNYHPCCSLPYQRWRRFCQFVAALSPPDFVFIVHAQRTKVEGAPCWIEDIYLRQSDAEASVDRLMKENPAGWAEWSCRTLMC